MNREKTKLAILQEQRDKIQQQISDAIDAAVPEIQEKVETFFKLIKEEYGIDIIQGEYEFTFNRDTDDQQDHSVNFDI